MDRTHPADIAAALFEGAPDGIVAFDRDCRYTLWNPAMERISGVPAAEVLGRAAGEVFPFLLETGEIGHFHAALRGEHGVSRERRYRFPETGSWGYFDAHYFPVVEDGLVTGGAAVVRNVTGRRRNRVRASAQSAVSGVLVAAAASDAPARILAAIGDATEWECGAYWEVDPDGAHLRCLVTWRADPALFAGYIEASHGCLLPRGDGLPGRCWERLETVWISDIPRDSRFAASPMATREGLRAAVAFPIRVGGRAIGVMEFFSRTPGEHDPELVALLEDLGAQFGQFVARRRVEESFRESQAHFRAVFEQAPFTIQVFAPDGRCLDANPAFEAFWGAGREWLAGYNLLADAQLEALGVMSRVRAAFAGEVVSLPPVRYDPARIGKPGRARWTEASLYPIVADDGEVSRVVLMHRDVTERVRLAEAEGALRQQLDEVRILLDTLPVGVLIAHDPQCRRITGNRVARRLMRVAPEANISMTPAAGDAIPTYRPYRDGAELVLEDLPLRRALAGKPAENLEYQLRFADGGSVDLLVTAAPLYDEHGAIRGAVATMLDITEQNRSRRALQEEDRRKTEFIATLAHELRNPLAPIRNAVEILRMKEAAPEVRSVFAIIDRQLRHLVRLVDDLLDVSRITRGRLELRPERLTVDALITQALEAARPAIEREGHALEVEAPAGDIALHGDGVRLVQALVNLLTNAAKYTPRGGGRIRVRVEVRGNDVAIRVADNGIGMTAAQAERAFEMFWQGKDAVERSQGGLGIGLSLARSVVEMHGGRLEAASEGPGRGSEFTMRLPLSPA